MMIAATHAIVTATASPSRPKGQLRKRLEVQTARLMSMRGQLEERRRKQLWRLANAVDEIVKEECDALEQTLATPSFFERTRDEVNPEVNPDEIEVTFKDDKKRGS